MLLPKRSQVPAKIIKKLLHYKFMISEDSVEVTSCSHIFCEEDGSREFNKAYSCPACESSLSGTFDIIRIDLQPSDQYKSMVLAGQKPEVIMEICSRALSFWTYQSHQERVYQEYIASKVKEKATQLEQYYEEVVSRIQSELCSLKLQQNATKKELETTKKKYGEVAEKLVEKTRQCQKLQSMYDVIRRKLISPINYEKECPEKVCNGFRNENFILSLSSADAVLRKLYTPSSAPPASKNCDDDFVLQPNHTPVSGVLHSGKHSKNRSVIKCL
ncbi:E3 ubiquitin-protein ligase CCNB1IP1 [Octopus bimaculoides]|uniref:E3 ubiquitin-protein ligase CCNB1IP1 n=1 Tax=Octopus bimaculoides TaxID=37653 RepID=UPI00071D0F7D|nr:E3 ubiquitin-protein ligase CCNB1IP1 [Octopus bimaculoides]|eukprot:XP_014769952.1 PREDICTED: E3 ubiquitin-protein ligase CCNB1IP1-like [Octopus bimaculoides]